MATQFAPEFEAARRAIDLPEVQGMIARLGEYGLGVCIPHSHSGDLDFGSLQESQVQVEENGRVTFQEASELPPNSVPVAWRWRNGGSMYAGVCVKMNDGSHKVLPGT